MIKYMMQYKFIRIKVDKTDDEIDEVLNTLSSEGWKVHNFFPTSDMRFGSKGILNAVEPWDVAYAFLLCKEV